MLKKGVITFIGTDAHNLEHRKVNIGPAIEVIEYSLGAGFIEQLEKRQYDILRDFTTDYFFDVIIQYLVFLATRIFLYYFQDQL